MSEEIKKEEQTEVKEESVEEVKKEDFPEESNLANKDKKKQHLIIAGIVGLITFVAVGGYFMMNKNNDPIDYESCVTGLRNWTIQEGTKDPDYLKGVKWNKEYIKEVTVNDEQVNTDKQGTYEITYLIDIKDEKEKDIEKEYKVEVVSREEAEKQAKDGKEVVTEEGIKNEKKTGKPKTEPTTQKEESKPSTNKEEQKPSKPSGGNTGSTEKPKPNHTHKWVEQFKTIHHDAVYENKYVVDQPAYDEQVPKYANVPVMICNDCGAELNASNCWDHIENHAMNGGKGSWTDTYKQVVVGYDTVHHPEQGHNEQVLVKEAWDEKVSAGYKCSCGATK